MKKFFVRKEKASSWLRFTLQGEREIPTNGKRVEDSQEYYYIQNQRFTIDWKVIEINDVISDFDFFEELFERHQESLWRKFKRF